ncbi:TetR/AcrR family transcriptional regulator [Marinobacter pelagius]|uniref:TetR/AcrR family transcriptional regulator n=1 Tax=Marinobacter sp. C7 TaxID=2951363 RepID=UPI001EF0AA98|nr:TetR/AcrR family transcriptional regulator [Marinobacter sp. C7]MCG7201505.1 TetR/AcrR family transcriptional regulator [Marinobacter sp. C7]
MSTTSTNSNASKTKQPSPRRTQEQRRKATRKQILAAAISLLQEKGYAGFRINEVAEKAQVSRGAQTHHFPTKESLLLAALEQVYSDSREDTFKLINSLGPESDLIAALFQDGENFFLGPYFSMALSLLNVGEGNASLGQQVQELSRENRRPLEIEWVKVFVERGIDQSLAENIVSSAYCLFRGLAVRQLLHVDPQHVKQQAEFWGNLLRKELKQKA